MISASLISDLEDCERRGYYSRSYEPRRIHPTEITRQSIFGALQGERAGMGQRAGDLAVELCATRGIEAGDVSHKNLYDIGIHYAAIADIVSTWLRDAIGVDLGVPDPKKTGNHVWKPGCLLNRKESRLLRFVLVDHVSEDRLLAESRTWYSIGEMAVYGLPMTVYVISLGQHRNDRRHSAWSKGLLHPKHGHGYGKLRFKRRENKSEGFKSTWIPLWREEHAEFSREEWLEAMHADHVIEDLHRVVKIAPLEPGRRNEILDMIVRKANRVHGLYDVPDPSYSACDWPRPCPFRRKCFGSQSVPLDKLGFRPIETILSTKPGSKGLEPSSEPRAEVAE